MVCYSSSFFAGYKTRETMGVTADFIIDNLGIDNTRIENIDLGLLARYFKILDHYFNSKFIAEDVEVGNEQPSVTSTKNRLIDFLLCNTDHYAERQIALKMIFDNILAAPQYIAEAERALGISLIETEGENR
jgi:hypothetical protein